MEQKIIIRKSDYVTETEEKVEKNLRVDYLRTHFSEYENFKEYLHIQVNDYNGLNLYLELNKYEMEDLIKLLQEKVQSM